MAIIENIRQKWHRNRQQQRLAIIQGELETAQRDCAALGAYIGQLIRRKSELEIDLSRDMTKSARGD